MPTSNLAILKELLLFDRIDYKRNRFLQTILSQIEIGRVARTATTVATKYHRLVREFLRDAGVADYALVDSQGATEGTVANGTAEAIADITSTGDTLRANHLKILSDGLVLASQATLWRSRTAGLDTKERIALATLLSRIV